MAEYIERKAIVNHLRECEGTPPEVAYTYPIFKALECFVEGLPAADVVEVVRCRDCKHHRIAENKKNFIYWHNCKLWCADIDEDDFCSYGERKDGADVQNT